MEILIKIIKALLVNQDGDIDKSAANKVMVFIFGMLAGFSLCCVLLFASVDDDEIVSGDSIELVDE